MLRSSSSLLVNTGDSPEGVGEDREGQSNDLKGLDERCKFSSRVEREVQKTFEPSRPFVPDPTLAPLGYLSRRGVFIILVICQIATGRSNYATSDLVLVRSSPFRPVRLLPAK